MIAIIDYKLGNLTSVKNALDNIGVPSIITDSPTDIKKAAGIIFPGVGAAGAGMKNLQAKQLDTLLITEIKSGKPFLGTCLGIQLLFDSSEEANTKCLGVIPGSVKKFQGELKVPQIGWNTVKITKPTSRILKNISSNSYFYFVNSYYPDPMDKTYVAGETDYGITFPSVIEKGNMFATQFHSEKSGDIGLQLLKNFCEVCL